MQFASKSQTKFHFEISTGSGLNVNGHFFEFQRSPRSPLLLLLHYSRSRNSTSRLTKRRRSPEFVISFCRKFNRQVPADMSAKKSYIQLATEAIKVFRSMSFS